MLLAIEQLLRERGTVSLRDLSIHFQSDAAALEPMLEQLVRKGRVRKTDLRGASCGKRCPGCATPCPEDAVIYQWAE